MPITLENFSAAIRNSKTNYSGYVELNSAKNGVQNYGNTFFARKFGFYSTRNVDTNRAVRQALFEAIRESGIDLQTNAFKEIANSIGFKVSGERLENYADKPLSRRELKKVLDNVNKLVGMEQKREAFISELGNEFCPTDELKEAAERFLATDNVLEAARNSNARELLDDNFKASVKQKLIQIRFLGTDDPKKFAKMNDVWLGSKEDIRNYLRVFNSVHSEKDVNDVFRFLTEYKIGEMMEAQNDEVEHLTLRELFSQEKHKCQAMKSHTYSVLQMNALLKKIKQEAKTRIHEDGLGYDRVPNEEELLKHCEETVRKFVETKGKMIAHLEEKSKDLELNKQVVAKIRCKIIDDFSFLDQDELDVMINHANDGLELLSMSQRDDVSKEDLLSALGKMLDKMAAVRQELDAIRSRNGQPKLKDSEFKAYMLRMFDLNKVAWQPENEKMEVPEVKESFRENISEHIFMFSKLIAFFDGRDDEHSNAVENKGQQKNISIRPSGEWVLVEFDNALEHRNQLRDIGCILPKEDADQGEAVKAFGKMLRAKQEDMMDIMKNFFDIDGYSSEVYGKEPWTSWKVTQLPSQERDFFNTLFSPRG